MEIIGGIVLSILALVLLALLGLATVFALGFMTVLGLLTDLSFKRLFFVSFALGLVAPLLLGVATLTALEDGSLERDLRADLGEIIDLPEERVGDWGETLNELQDLRRDIEDGDLEDQEIEKRLEDIFSGDEGASLELEADPTNESNQTLQIKAE